MFPKGDHVNVGVGGWRSEGPRRANRRKAVADVLAGRATSLAGYEHGLAAALRGLPVFSWRLKVAVDRHPRFALAIVRLPPVWPVVEAVVRGDLRHPGLARGVARVPVAALRALSRQTARDLARARMLPRSTG